MSLEPLQFAIIGRGLPAQHRFTAIHRSKTTDLVAAIDTTKLRTNVALETVPIHPIIGGLRLPSPKPSIWVGIDEQSIASAVNKSEAVALSDPRLCTLATIEELFTQGKHIIAEYLPTTSSSDLGALYDQAAANGLHFHLSCVSLFQGVPLTMRARVQPVSIRNAKMTYENTGLEPDDARDLVYRNIGALVHLVSLTDAIQFIDEVSYQQRVLTAKMTTVHGAPVTLSISQTASPDTTLNFTVEDHATTWRQTNDALYQGRSPQTILQGMQIYQDDLARFTRAVRTGSSIHPSKELWVAVMTLAEPLSLLQSGSLSA